MRPLSLSPLTVLPCSPLEQIDAAQAAGFDAVGLRLQPALATDLDVMSDAALQRAIERRLAATGLRVLDVEVFRVGPRTDIAAMEGALAYAAGLGASNLLFTCLPPAEYRADDEPHTVGKIRELCEAAARHGIRPMLEFMIFRGIGRLEDALRIIAQVGHPGLGICVDALHLHRSGGSPASLAGLDPRLLCSLQLCDAPAQAPADLAYEARYDRLYPGNGALPLPDMLAAVPADVPLSVEVPCVAMAARSAAERAIEAARCTRRLLSNLGSRPMDLAHRSR